MPTIGELFQKFLQENSGIRPKVDVVETLYETLEKMEQRYAQNGLTGEQHAALAANLAHYVDANGVVGVPDTVKHDVEELFVRSVIHRENLLEGEAKRLAHHIRYTLLPALENTFIDTTAKLTSGDKELVVIT